MKTNTMKTNIANIGLLFLIAVTLSVTTMLDSNAIDANLLETRVGNPEHCAMCEKGGPKCLQGGDPAPGVGCNPEGSEMNSCTEAQGKSKGYREGEDADLTLATQNCDDGKNFKCQRPTDKNGNPTNNPAVWVSVQDKFPCGNISLCQDNQRNTPDPLCTPTPPVSQE